MLPANARHLLALGLLCALSPLSGASPLAAQAPAALELQVTRSAGPLAEGPLRAGLRARRQQLLDCLRPSGDLPGPDGASATLRIMVASNGDVVTVEVQEPHQLPGEACIARVAETAEFPRRPAFTTFTVRVRLGSAVHAPESPRGAAAHTAAARPARVGISLALTRVRGALRPSTARRGFMAARPAMRACYAAEAARSGVSELRVHLVVQVDSEGRVLRVGQRAGEVLSDAFESCLDRALRARAFPAPSEGGAEIEQSMRLRSLPAGE